MAWISVKDRLPARDTVVLVAAVGGWVTTAEWYQAHGWALAREDTATGIVADTITHWMPLPEPPATDETRASVERSIDKFGDAFTEMKRLGD